MVRKGLVVSVNPAENSGIIEDANGQDFLFTVYECCELELPGIFAEVTFMKDPDFRSTRVAMLIKRVRPPDELEALTAA